MVQEGVQDEGSEKEKSEMGGKNTHTTVSFYLLYFAYGQLLTYFNRCSIRAKIRCRDVTDFRATRIRSVSAGKLWKG